MRICREGWPFILGCLVASDIFLLGGIFYKSFFCVVLAALFFLATAFCAYFFRDPARVIPPGENLIRAPADGKILAIIEGKDAGVPEPVWILRIFLSVFEPHLQRAPVAGTVKQIAYKKRHLRMNKIELKSCPHPDPLPMGEGAAERRVRRPSSSPRLRGLSPDALCAG